MLGRNSVSVSCYNSEIFGKSPAREFRESREEPGSGVWRVSGKPDNIHMFRE